MRFTGCTRLNDGWLYVVADTPEERHALCRALDCEDLLRDHTADRQQAPSGRYGTGPCPGPTLCRPVVSTTSLARLQAAGVPCAPAVSGHSEIFLSDPHAIANDMVATYQHPLLGQKRVARHYVRFGHTEVLQGRPTALLGEHTREVLQEVGFTENAIAELYAKGVVKTQEPLAAP